MSSTGILPLSHDPAGQMDLNVSTVVVRTDWLTARNLMTRRRSMKLSSNSKIVGVVVVAMTDIMLELSKRSRLGEIISHK